MSISATTLAAAVTAGTLALSAAAPLHAVTRPHQPVQGWAAMAGVDTATLLRQIRHLPVSDLAIEDQPYCAADAEITRTLSHDFDESRVQTSARKGAELWGSDLMGTWTMVAPRGDGTSCIIASGIGFDQARDPDVYYASAGLG